MQETLLAEKITQEVSETDFRNSCWTFLNFSSFVSVLERDRSEITDNFVPLLWLGNAAVFLNATLSHKHTWMDWLLLKHAGSIWGLCSKELPDLYSIKTAFLTWGLKVSVPKDITDYRETAKCQITFFFFKLGEWRFNFCNSEHGTQQFKVMNSPPSIKT